MVVAAMAVVAVVMALLTHLLVAVMEFRTPCTAHRTVVPSTKCGHRSMNPGDLMAAGSVAWVAGQISLTMGIDSGNHERCPY
jgi:hypothetical protein